MGVLTADEMDSIYDVLKAHYFTQDQPKGMPEHQLDAVMYVYQALAANSSIRWNFIPNSGKTPLTQESYLASVPNLIKHLLNPSDKDPELRSFLQSLPEENEIAKYLQELKSNDLIEFVAYRDQKGDLKLTPRRISNILAIWKEEINRLLFMTAKKQIGEHYGPDPDGSFMAIPYALCNNPIRGSQHGTDLEIDNYTIQMYMARELPQFAILNEIEEIKTRIVEELKPIP